MVKHQGLGLKTVSSFLCDNKGLSSELSNHRSVALFPPH